MVNLATEPPQSGSMVPAQRGRETHDDNDSRRGIPMFMLATAWLFCFACLLELVHNAPYMEEWPD
jgi:hypothetical protein